MRCPFCSNSDTQVKDSRPSEDGLTIRRRRYCPACHSRFTTFERIQLRELTVLKRNGERRVFDRDKILRSIQIATRKRPVNQDDIERLVNNIVKKLESGGESEIKSDDIGKLVMEGLKDLDDVSYIRYASVYRDFREAKDFGEIASELKKT